MVWGVAGLKGRHEVDACDLAGAHRDRHAQRVLVGDEGGFKMPAVFRGGRKLIQRLLAHDFGRQLFHGMARTFDAAADRVRREEVAQDDPEPFHVGSIGSGFGPAESKRLRPTNLWAWCLILLGTLDKFSYGLGKAVSPVLGGCEHGPVLRQAQDEAFPSSVSESASS